MLSSHRRVTHLSRPGPHPGVPVLAATIFATALAAAPLAAQGPGTFELFAQRKQSSTQPIFGGISFAHYGGPIGIRFSGGLNFSGSDNSTQSTVVADESGYDCRYYGCGGRRGPGRGQRYQDYSGMSLLPSIGGWTADADLIVAPVRAIGPLRALLLGFSPYGFVGVGGYSVHPKNAIDTTRATWSLGAGAHHQLLGALGVAAEARYRQPFTSDSAGIAPDWKQKLEYRASLTISFGGHKRSPQVISAAPPVPVAPCTAVPCGGVVTVQTADPRIASRVLDVADGLVDTPYRSGGDTPRSGFDAGGFVQYVFGQQNVSLPRTVEELSHTGTSVPTTIGSLRPGDLLFFSNDGTNADHVAIYAGRERIIHSTASGNGVRYDTLGEGERGHWFADHLIRARRVITADASNAPAPREDRNDGDRAPRPIRSIP